jgi:hypothetical protein
MGVKLGLSVRGKNIDWGCLRIEEDVTGGWRRLHEEEVHNLCFSPKIINDQIKEEMGGECSTHER